MVLAVYVFLSTLMAGYRASFQDYPAPSHGLPALVGSPPWPLYISPDIPFWYIDHLSLPPPTAILQPLTEALSTSRKGRKQHFKKKSWTETC